MAIRKTTQPFLNSVQKAFSLNNSHCKGQGEMDHVPAEGPLHAPPLLSRTHQGAHAHAHDLAHAHALAHAQAHSIGVNVDSVNILYYTRGFPSSVTLRVPPP